MFVAVPTSESAMFFFYTNKLNFESTFLGELKFVYAFGSILGLIIYNVFLRNVDFKK